MKTVLVRICLCLFLSFFLYGHIYFWTDDTGIKHFSNISPPQDKVVDQLTESHVVFQKLISKENKHQVFRVVKVFDGDTIQVTGLDLTFSIRLVGIDSPEIGYRGQLGQPFGQQAKQYLMDLLTSKPVRLKSYGTGGYNRQLAEVFVEDKNLNMEMIRAGLAEVYTGKSPKQLDLKRYKTEELKARWAGKGIWTQGRSYTSPKQWRKEHPRK
ncbi:MAG: thermonuclease family protein [Desulfobacula sp.]|nr:thermonuclease family protein [Desulfobacula sp.]